jgi:hypothetical protein
VIGVEIFRGTRALSLFALLGAAGVAATLAGLPADPGRTLFSWLFAWLYWAGLAIGALILLGTFHASHARWTAVVRRVVETAACALPLMAVLSLPILLGMSDLFPWAHPRDLTEEMRHLAEHHRPYLNGTFFVVRTILYFVIWIAVSELLLAWSRRQDREPALALTTRQRALGIGALPAISIAASFATLDWIMSLDLTFASTVFALYWFAGAFLGVLCAVAVATALMRGPGQFGAYANASHLAALGKLILGMVVFWFYIAFCQYMLTWIADVPHEVRWYLVRVSGRWRRVTIVLVIVQFVIPFLCLLSRPLKEHPASLTAVSLWLLAAHALDTYWLVLPARDPAAPVLRWTDVTAFVGLGGLSLAFTLWRMRGHFTLPVHDPYLAEALRYQGQ